MSDTVMVVVEIPKGSRNKYELDPATGQFHLDRVLFSSVHYPTDYGFVDQTLARDGDALDALVLIDEPTFSGCRIECRAIGMLVMRDEKGDDEKVLCVPLSDPLWNRSHRLADVPSHLLTEIDHFFSSYKELEGKPTAVLGWQDRDEAERVIAESRSAFRSPPE